MFHKFLFEGWRVSHGTCPWSQSLVHEAPCLFHDQLQAGINGVVNGNGALLASQNLWCCSATIVPFNNSKQLHSIPNSPTNAYTYFIYFTQRTQSVGNTKVQCVFAVFYWAQVKCMHATIFGSNVACWKTEISLVCQHGKQTWWGLQWGSCNLEFGPVFGSCSHSGTMVLQLNSVGVAASRICFAESLYTHCCWFFLQGWKIAFSAQHQGVDSFDCLHHIVVILNLKQTHLKFPTKVLRRSAKYFSS